MKTIFAALACAVCLCTPVRADDFVAAPHLGGMVLDQDTQAGKYSVWRLTDLAGIDAVRTTLAVHRLGDDPRWAPGFGITLSAGDQSVMFQLVSPTRQAPLEIHLFRYDHGKQVDDIRFKTTAGLDEKLAVSVDWSAAGVVTVRLGNGETQTLTLGAPATQLDFSASTGEGEYNPLSIGHAGP
ncbi:MAG: hypothetical protein ACREHE_02920 [Rhizomicrobium sp.]